MPASIEQLEKQREALEQQIREAKRVNAMPALVSAVKSGNTEDIVQACYKFLAQYRTRRGKKNKGKSAPVTSPSS